MPVLQRLFTRPATLRGWGRCGRRVEPETLRSAPLCLWCLVNGYFRGHIAKDLELEPWELVALALIISRVRTWRFTIGV